MLCLVCGAEAPLGFISHLSLLGCVNAMKAELAEWRTGRRRVYWQTRRELSGGYIYCSSGYCEAGAKREAGQDVDGSTYPTMKLVRRTVGPRGNVRPWVKK